MIFIKSKGNRIIAAHQEVMTGIVSSEYTKLYLEKLDSLSLRYPIEDLTPSEEIGIGEKLRTISNVILNCVKNDTPPNTKSSIIVGHLLTTVLETTWENNDGYVKTEKNRPYSGSLDEKFSVDNIDVYSCVNMSLHNQLDGYERIFVVTTKNSSTIKTYLSDNDTDTFVYNTNIDTVRSYIVKVL